MLICPMIPFEVEVRYDTIESTLTQPKEIKALLLPFYGKFEDGQLRKTDNPFGIPVGDVVRSK